MLSRFTRRGMKATLLEIDHDGLAMREGGAGCPTGTGLANSRVSTKFLAHRHKNEFIRISEWFQLCMQVHVFYSLNLNFPMSL
jgi:hypothetical protein